MFVGAYGCGLLLSSLSVAVVRLSLLCAVACLFDVDCSLPFWFVGRCCVLRAVCCVCLIVCVC